MDPWNLFINLMSNLLILIYAYVGNFGVAIILFTILIKAATHPFMVSQIKSSTKMQEFMQSEEWKKIQAKYKDDKETLAREQMRMYQEHGVNPFASCLPSLIQLPIIIGLYQAIIRVMATSPLQLVDMVRGFYGWMGDLAPQASLGAILPIQTHFLWMNLGQPERILADVVPFTLFGGIPVLAIIVGLTTYVQTKLTVTPSASPDDQTAQMNSMMGIYMPIMLFFFSLNFASGLAVYFVTSNVVGILQYALLGKVNWKNLFTFGPAPVAATPSTPVKTKNRK